MRIATRLVLALGVTTTAIMAAYAMIAFVQREALLRDALIRETETLARALQIVTNNALRDARFGDLDRVLARITDDAETFVAAALDPENRVIGGGPASALACFRGQQALGAEPATELRGWIECEGRVRWVTLPLQAPAARLVVGRRATVVEADIAASKRRILATTLVLAGAAALATVIVLRSALTLPLADIMRGVHALGAPNPPAPVRVPRSTSELRDLAVAFNEMAERLEGKRRALIQEAEERVALDRRLRRAEKFAALGRLTGGMAHELGSPLNVIGMRAEAIGSMPGLPPEARRQAAEIVAEVERVAELVRALGHVSRRHPVEPVPVDLNAVAGAVHGQLAARAAAADVALRLENSATPLLVEGDAALLRHAVSHLVLNAVQAVERGAGERQVWIRIEGEEDMGRVVVEDTGPGIPDEHVAQLFEPFFTTKDVGEGTGLGLAISQGIAEEHGGELRIEVRGEGGVRAVLRLPREEAEDGAGDG